MAGIYFVFRRWPTGVINERRSGFIRFLNRSRIIYRPFTKSYYPTTTVESFSGFSNDDVQ